MSQAYFPGFHGDTYLLKIVDTLMSKVCTFIETGTSVGTTLNYIARKYKMINCLSCEPYLPFYTKAAALLHNIENVHIFNESSQRFMRRLKKNGYRLFMTPTLFWLDAHGKGFQWPLKEEITFITASFNSGFILIDDFKVPNLKMFQFDTYKKQQCSFDYIKTSINKDKKYRLYYPKYTKHTSTFHPLIGWGLIQFGNLYNLDKKLPIQIDKANSNE